MKKELDEALCAKYPKIFANRNGDMRETCMCWGFECGDGWYTLLDELCEKLTVLVDKGVASKIIADQVKEKYGTLRFYVSTEGDPHMIVEDVIAIAERQSSITCEVCGEYGQITSDDGWLSVRCKKHREEEENGV